MKSNPMKLNDQGRDIYGTHISQHLDSKKRCPSEAERVRSWVSGWDLTDVNGVSLGERALEESVKAVPTGDGGVICEFADGSHLVASGLPYGGYVIP